IGKFSCCIALVRQFLMARHPGGDRTDDRLSTGVDMNVLDCDALLTLAAATIERLGQSGEGAGEFTRLVQALAPPMKALPVNCGTAVAPSRHNGWRPAARRPFPRARLPAASRSSR